MLGKTLWGRVCPAAFVALAGLGVHAVAPLSAQSQQPIFRAGTTLVPLDVRVVDREGRLVSGLTTEDFEILEDGVAQTIAHFERYALTPTTPGPALERSSSAPLSVGAPHRRIFYIELDDTWLGNPQFGLVEAIARFLRHGLAPQDRAVVAWRGRMTDLTSDHEALARVVERLAALHTRVHGATSPIRALYNWRTEPEGSPARGALDEVFAPASPGLRLSPRPHGEFSKILDSTFLSALSGSTAGQSSLQVAGITVRRMLAVIGALQFLRYLEGDKHLISFVAFPRTAVESDRYLANLAADARVSIHSVSGINGVPPQRHIEGLWAEMSARNLAGWTGGTVFLNRWPEDIFSTIDAVSRSGYMLAYTPRRAPDDKWRKVVVRVRRPGGARVLVRDTYLATSTPPAYDPSTHAAQQAMLTVAQFPGGVDDLQVQATAKQISGTATMVDVTINVSPVQFTRAAERHVAKLEVAVFCMDSRDRLLGQRWVTLDLKLTDDTLAKVRAEGLRQTVAVTVTGRVKALKAVAYDYGTTRAGAAVAEVK
jgi:VWFA-related protein